MKATTPVALALLVGSVAAFLVARWVGPAKNTPASFPQVVVAAQAIEPGHAIAAPALKTITWSGPQAPEGAHTQIAAVVGRIARQPIAVGEPVVNAALAPEGAQPGLAATLPLGKRAISVRVNDVIAVAGFTLPGNFVDVIVSGRDMNQMPFAQTVITRAKVLAIAQETSAADNKPKVVNAVTLELTPKDVEKLDLARSVGTLSLVLRNEFDEQPLPSPGIKLSELVGQAPAAEPSKPVPPTAAQPNKPTKSGTALARKTSSHPTARASATAPKKAPAVQEIRGMQQSEVTP